jgi:hypothetical protein
MSTASGDELAQRLSREDELGRRVAAVSMPLAMSRALPEMTSFGNGVQTLRPTTRRS